MEVKKYFKQNQQKEKSRINLFCFPYAGGGASVFRRWQAEMGDLINVYPAHYPGHEERIMENPMREMNELVSALYEEIKELVHYPFFLFGHSVGSRVAYELALRLEGAGQKNLCGIIVSAGLAPDRKEVNPIYQLEEEEFFKELSQYGRTQRDLFDNKDLWAIFEPILRADFTLADTYQDKEHRKLHVPILALRGTRDSEISSRDLHEWGQYTTEEFTCRDIAGEHLFIDTNPKELLPMIKEYIMKAFLNQKQERKM